MKINVMKGLNIEVFRFDAGIYFLVFFLTFLIFVLFELLFRWTAELGDYNPDEHKGNYISDYRFIPHQTEDFEKQVSELHKQHRSVCGERERDMKKWKTSMEREIKF